MYIGYIKRSKFSCKRESTLESMEFLTLWNNFYSLTEVALFQLDPDQYRHSVGSCLDSSFWKSYAVHWRGLPFAQGQGICWLQARQYKNLICRFKLLLNVTIHWKVRNIIFHLLKYNHWRRTGPGIIQLFRPPDKSAYWKTIFFISHTKHMLWVLKRTVSMRRFFWVPKTHV